MVILVSNASSTNGAVLTTITIPDVLMFCPLMKQYSLVLLPVVLSGQNFSTTGMAILVSTAPLVDRTSVQQEW
jgi:hypothetical protein